MLYENDIVSFFACQILLKNIFWWDFLLAESMGRPVEAGAILIRWLMQISIVLGL